MSVSYEDTISLLQSNAMQIKVRQLVVNFLEGNNATVEILMYPKAVYKDDIRVHFLVPIRDPNYDKSAIRWALLAKEGYLIIDNNISKINEFSSIYHVRIPNRVILNVFGYSIVAWIKYKLNIDLEQLRKVMNMENMYHFNAIIEDIIIGYNKAIALNDDVVLQALVEYICLIHAYSHESPKEILLKDETIGNIFYRIIGKSNKVIIHQCQIFKNVKDEDDINKRIHNTFWEICEKDYVQKNDDIRHYACIEVQLIAIFTHKNNSLKLNSKIEFISHSMTQFKKIFSYLKNLGKEEYNHLKNNNNNMNDIINLIRNDDDINNENIIIKELGIAIKSKKLAEELIKTYGKDLFYLSKKSLCAINRIGEKKASVIEEFGHQIQQNKYLI